MATRWAFPKRHNEFEFEIKPRQRVIVFLTSGYWQFEGIGISTARVGNKDACPYGIHESRFNTTRERYFGWDQLLVIRTTTPCTVRIGKPT